jgi:hypothetical protein
MSRDEIQEMWSKFPHHLTKPERRCGNTTRLVDHYIQHLFDHGNVDVIDHHTIQKLMYGDIESVKSSPAQQIIDSMFIARLSLMRIRFHGDQIKEGTAYEESLQGVVRDGFTFKFV